MTGRGLRRAGGPGLAGAAVTALLACSVSIGSGGLNATKLQDAIRNRIQQATGVAPDSVTCPDDAKQGKGNDFQCAAVVEGQSVPVDVTQTDDSGRVTFAAAVAMLQRTAVERVIQTDVQKKGAHPVTANCGRSAVVVAKVGSTFSCVLEAGAGPETAVVAVHGTDGRFSVRYPPSDAATGAPTGAATNVATGSSATHLTRGQARS
ncbi:MAG: DUF4333 domain-containing protein [Frankiaceae bacterium]